MRAAIERERKKCNRRRATLPRDESKAGEKSVFLKQDGQRFILKNEQAKRRRENHERAKKHAMSRLPSWCLLLPSSGAKEISARNDPRVGRTKKKPRNPFTSRFESRESVLLKRPTKQKHFCIFASEAFAGEAQNDLPSSWPFLASLWLINSSVDGFVRVDFTEWFLISASVEFMTINFCVVFAAMDIFRIFFHAFPATWDSGMNKEKKNNTVSQPTISRCCCGFNWSASLVA